MGESETVVEDVESYYTRMLDQFRRTWSATGNKSIHNGYYDDHSDSADPPTENMNRELAEAVAVSSSDRVLNIGCGAGGDAVWLAIKRNAEVVGVDICDPFLEEGREQVREFGIDDRVSFVHDDYHDLSTIGDDEFDVVWSLESIGHSPAKQTVLSECGRVLKDGGRIVIAEIFVHSDDPSDSDRKRIEKVNDRLRYNISKIDAFEEALAGSGFSEIEVRDITSFVEPSVERQYKASVLSLPWYKLMTPLGIASRPKSDLVHGAYHEHKLFKSGVFGFDIVSATW